MLKGSCILSIHPQTETKVLSILFQKMLGFQMCKEKLVGVVIRLIIIGKELFATDVSPVTKVLVNNYIST